MMFIGSVVLFLAVTAIDAQNECSDRNSICISIHNCPEMLAAFRGPKSLSPQIIQTLRNAQCGVEGQYPKVCCTRQQTTGTLLSRTYRSNPDNTTNPPDVTNHPNLRLLDHQACGPITQTKIVFGNKTAIFQYPWMALLAYERAGRPGLHFLCGGTIISSRYVLTAAHCVTSLPDGVRLIGVRVGDHDISKERDCEYFNGDIETICAEKYQDFDVDNFYFHPEYTTTEFQNDIGLIRLNDSIDFAPQTVRPICLPLGTAAKVNLSRAKVTGWNLAEFDRRNTYLLKEGQLVVPNEQCKEKYNQSKYQIWYKQLCAGGGINVIGDPNTCLGDGGSPLQTHSVYGTSVRVVQYGILSYGATSCGIPDVYTRVAYYMDWILNTMTD